jgi:anti-sigma B factor antagonist
VEKAPKTPEPPELAVSPVSAGGPPVRASLWVDVQRGQVPPVARVRAAGELDLATAPRLQTALDALLRDGYCQLDVDLDDVGFCDVAGLNLLLRARAAAVAAGGDLVVHGRCPTLRLMLRVLHLERAFGPTQRKGEPGSEQA